MIEINRNDLKQIAGGELSELFMGSIFSIVAYSFYKKTILSEAPTLTDLATSAVVGAALVLFLDID